MNQNLNIIFAGTPEFSAHILTALFETHHAIKAVYTQPDRPSGRGRQLTPSPVKQLALQYDIPVYQPLSLRDREAQNTLENISADLMIVVAYGLLLPKKVLEIPHYGCINVHASLLPRWRGAAPIQRAILAGDEKTGVTIMRMDEGLDTGPMLYKMECPIQEKDTSETLFHRLAELGAAALLHILEQFSGVEPQLQDNALATYAHKIKKEEAKINWNLPADFIARQVRAFNPWPVAFSSELRIWEAMTSSLSLSDTTQPGTIIQASSDGIDVATGNGVLRLLKCQLPGGRVLPVSDILNARQQVFIVGKVL